jgi:hypothetical protein
MYWDYAGVCSIYGCAPGNSLFFHYTGVPKEIGYKEESSELEDDEE